MTDPPPRNISDEVAQDARSVNIVTSLCAPYIQTDTHVLPDSLARAVWQAHDHVADADLARGGSFAASRLTSEFADWSTNARWSDPVPRTPGSEPAAGSGAILALNGISGAVIGAIDSHHRGADAPAAAGTGAVAGIASMTAGGTDSVINAVTGVAHAVAPSMAPYADYAAGMTPSATISGIAAAGIERTSALANGDHHAVDRNTEQLLSGDFGRAMQGYAVFGYALRDAPSRTDLIRLADNGTLGPLAQASSAAVDFLAPPGFPSGSGLVPPALAVVHEQPTVALPANGPSDIPANAPSSDRSSNYTDQNGLSYHSDGTLREIGRDAAPASENRCDWSHHVRGAVHEASRAEPATSGGDSRAPIQGDGPSGHSQADYSGATGCGASGMATSSDSPGGPAFSQSFSSTASTGDQTCR